MNGMQQNIEISVQGNHSSAAFYLELNEWHAAKYRESLYGEDTHQLHSMWN